MTLRIETAKPKNVHCLRVHGAYYESVPKGFQAIIHWAKQHNLTWNESLALYWDDPSETAPDDLRADVGLVLVPENTDIDDDSGITRQTLAGGLFAVWHTIVYRGEFAKAWTDLYEALPNAGYAPARGICYETYLCDGSSGAWEIEIWQSVEPLPARNKQSL